MPEYLAPGVFVEEVSFRAKSIEGVSTSVAGMAGPTAYGPVRGTPELLTSYGEFERVFGVPSALAFGGTQYLNHTALAARAFFENGGKQLYVSRVVAGGNDTDDEDGGSSAQKAQNVGANASFRARFPGSGGNLDLEFIWQDQQNLLKTKSLSVFDSIADGSSGFLTVTSATGFDQSVITTPGSFQGGTFTLTSLQVLATRTGDNLVFAGANAVVRRSGQTADETVLIADLGDHFIGASLAGLAFSFKQVSVAAPDSGALAAGTAAQIVLSSTDTLQTFSGFDASLLNRPTLWRGTLNAAGSEITLYDAEFAVAPGSPVTIPLYQLAAVTSSLKSITIQRHFYIDVIRRTGSTAGEGEPIYQTSVLSLTGTDSNFIGKVLVQSPEKALDRKLLPMAFSTALTTLTVAQLMDLFDAGTLNPSSTSYAEPRYIVALAGGTDGEMPSAIDYQGETDDKGSTGLAALEEVEDVSIVLTPAAVIDATRHQSIVSEVEKHCMKMRYRMGIVDSREDMSISELRTFRNNFDNSRLALYSPWVVVADPTGEKLNISVPPSGFMAGIYARTDVERGVHKAPANTVVQGALSFHQNINKFQQEVLNPQGINCLRSFAGRGHRVWGGRTLSSDPEWKYVNVRRYFLYLEKSIEKGTQWAVFEPNGENLWANVTATVDSFLFNEWKNGRLLGSKPNAAYFVRCDRTTMTQNDIDNGRLVCEIGIAPLRPAEFVIFRIGQKTADA